MADRKVIERTDFRVLLPETIETIRRCRGYDPDVHGLLSHIDSLNDARDTLSRLLSDAVNAVETLIADDPERVGTSFIDTGCQECTEGNTPASFDTGRCWFHEAQKLLEENYG